MLLFKNWHRGKKRTKGQAKAKGEFVIATGGGRRKKPSLPKLKCLEEKETDGQLDTEPSK